MSCFIVSAECMQRTVTAALILCDRGMIKELCGVRLIEAGDVMTDNDAGRLLWAKLYAFNEKAFQIAYQGRYSQDGTRPDGVYATTFSHQRCRVEAWDAIALAKSVQSFVYQCAEGEFVDGDEFRALQGFSAKVDTWALSLQPAYDAAVWG